MSSAPSATATAGAELTTADTPSEQRWVERARRGDHDAYTQLVQARLPGTFRTMLSILGDEADARDATQAVFVRTWQSLPSLRDATAFPAWFGRIVVNTARSGLRNRRRRLVREVRVDLVEDGGVQAATVRHDDHVADQDRLERALEELAPGDRLLLWLHHYEELSLAHIGDRLGVPPKTVKSRLFSARRALERALARQDA